MKRKQIIRERRFDGVDLFLKLDRVIIRDPLSLWTLPSSERSYQVVWWIEDPEGESRYSRKVTGSPNPRWDSRTSRWDVGLKGNPVGESHFVNVEVLRYNSNENHCDPGTSDHIGEVLRARIPFPKRLDEVIEGRYELVKHDGAGSMRPAGDMVLSMELATWTKDYYYGYY